MARANRPQIRSLARKSRYAPTALARCARAALGGALLTAALSYAPGCESDELPAFANPPPEDAGTTDAGAQTDAATDDAGEAASDSGPP